MSETKVAIADVEQALMQALKKATEAGYSDKYSSNGYEDCNLEAVQTYSMALQRIATMYSN